MSPRRRAPASAAARLRRGWWALAIAVAGVAFQGIAVWRVLVELDPGERPRLLDSIIFEYVGWAIVDGATLYVDIWEIKPPLAYAVPVALAALPLDVGPYHWANVAVTSLLAVAAAVAAGAVVHELTDDDLAALAAGLTLYALPAFHWRAAFGFKVKYAVVLAGLLGLLLAIRRRPFPAGIAAGLAAGTWQLGVGFLVPTAMLAARDDRAALRPLVAGVAAVALASLLSVLAWGSLEAMVAGVVVTPLLFSQPRNIPGMVRVLRRAGELLVPAIAIGVVGLDRSARGGTPAGPWLLAGVTWFAAALWFDLDSLPDLFPLLGLLGVCVGIGVAGRRDAVRRGLAALMVVVAAVNVATLGGVAGAPLTVPAPAPVSAGAVEPPYAPSERRAIYWRRIHPRTCRPFVGGTQAHVITAADVDPFAPRCGDLDPLLDGAIG